MCRHTFLSQVRINTLRQQFVSLRETIPLYNIRMLQFESQHFDQYTLCKCVHKNNTIPHSETIQYTQAISI